MKSFHSENSSTPIKYKIVIIAGSLIIPIIKCKMVPTILRKMSVMQASEYHKISKIKIYISGKNWNINKLMNLTLLNK